MIGRPAAPAALLVLLLGVAASARAQVPGSDDLDDPKLARRLKTRIALPAAPVAAAARVAPPVVLPPPPSRPSLVAASSSAPASPPPAGTAGSLVAKAPPPRRETDEGKTPVLQLGYRHFSFVQIGAVDSGSTVGAAAREPFESLSFDFYPVSRFVRFGLSTQYGWQSGRFNSGGGDYFIAQSATLGIQRPGVIATPFIEALAGAGYMRRFQFERTIPTAYWQMGVDVGASFFVARHGFFSAAIGYLRPVNGFAKQQSFASLYLDTWSFKLGLGI